MADDKFRWTPQRLSMLRNLWMKATPVPDIATAIGAPRAGMVSSKARYLGLPIHPTAQKQNSDTRERGRPTLPLDDDDEDAAPILNTPRLPAVPFLSRRFPWEDAR